MTGPDLKKYRQQAGSFFSKNLFKIMAGRIPLTDFGVDLVDRLEAHETDQRISNLECALAEAALSHMMPRPAF